MKKLFFIFLLVLIVFLYFVQPKRFRNNLEDLNNSDEVRIQIVESDIDQPSDRVNVISTIDDPARIDLIIEKLRDYSDDWQHRGFMPPPITGQPAPIQIVFFKEGDLVSFLSIGYLSDDSSYFIQENLKYQGKYLEHPELKELLDFLEVDEQFVSYSDD